MKSCPTCKRTYDDSLRFCLEDGSVLSASYDPQATQRLPGRVDETVRINASKPSPKRPDTIPSPGSATIPSPPHLPFGPHGKSRTDEGFSRRWLLISVPIFVVLLIPVLVGGIWLLTTIIKGGRSERRWLAMLGRGQVRAPTVVQEATTELAKNPRNAVALRARSAAL